MARQRFERSFASYQLFKNNFKLYADGKRILSWNPENAHPSEWDEQITTKIQIGSALVDEANVLPEIIEDYEDVLKLGLRIDSVSVIDRRFKNQRVEYVLRRRTGGPTGAGMPQQHYVEYLPVKKLARIVGPNSNAAWVPLSLHYNRKTDSSFVDDFNSRLLGSLPFQVEQEAVLKEIPELPFMITTEGELACFTRTRDAPVIGVFGQRGQGKTFFTHRFGGGAFSKWKTSVCFLNDLTNETEQWCLPWQESFPFGYQLKKVHEPSVPMPITYLHPMTNTLKYILNEDECGFKIGLSYRDAILDHNGFVQGKEEWVFKNCKTWFDSLIYDNNMEIDEHGLAAMTDIEDIDMLVARRFDSVDESTKANLAVINKIRMVMRDMWNEKFFDVATGIPSKWSLEFPDGKKEDLHPIIAAMVAGIIPMVVTSDLKKKSYYPQFMRMFLNECYNFQTTSEWSLKNKMEMFVFIDEIHRLFENEICKKTVDTVIRESRNARMGFCYATQYAAVVPESIITNTNYIISFFQTRSQANEFVKNFNLPKSVVAKIATCRKLQCVAMTNDSFIVYDKDYNRREVGQDEPLKGTLLPPNSRHVPPREI